jgi:murein DD-endopeptidase MepM/ murein hydrolase activator NlpD
VLLTCKDVSSMLTRAQMVKSVSQQDNAILDDLMKKMEEIEKEKKKLEEKRTELTNDKKQLESNKKELQSSIDEINKSKSELDSEVAECNSIMKELSSQSSEYMELIETNQAQLEQVESEIRAAIASASRGSGSISGSTGGGSGQLGYPTDSRSISAGYPNYSSGGYHGGIDFPVRTGSNVYAAASGTVILVKYLNYSYGRYIIIDHGDGLSTLYAHNSSISVSVGDKVSRGQVIAHSGSTGNSTGPHCHFEVRVNGSRVNPNNYL